MRSTSPYVQDHVILLLSTQDFDNPPSWLKDNFNILEGGNHTDQPSRNKLIVFSDGTYLELFNWIDNPPPSNAWSKRSPGLIDFAISALPPSTAESVFEEINTQFREQRGANPLGFRYDTPQSGGRTRKDGVEIKWVLSRPIATESSSPAGTVTAAGHRKDLPFFCHDVTARNLRVPFDDSEKTAHPCGATGISAVELHFPAPLYHDYVNFFEKLLGTSNKGSGDSPYDEFDINAPVDGANPSRILLLNEQIQDESLRSQERGVSIRALRLHTEGREGHGLRALGPDGIASTVSLEW